MNHTSAPASTVLDAGEEDSEAGAEQPVHEPHPPVDCPTVPAVSSALLRDALAARQSVEFGVPGPSPSPASRVVVTRFWGQSSSDLGRLDAFLNRVLPAADHVIVVVRAERDVACTAAHVAQRSASSDPEDGGARITALSVAPWTGPAAVHAAAIAAAGALDAEWVLSMSVDVEAGPEAIACLFRAAAAQHDLLVLGLALPHHVFAPGVHAALGALSPWNTAAVWHLPTLATTNFAAMSDSAVRGVGGSIEEPFLISQLQTRAFAPARSGVVRGPLRALRNETLRAPDTGLDWKHLPPRAWKRASAAVAREASSQAGPEAESIPRIGRRWRALLAFAPGVRWSVPGLSARATSRQPFQSVAEMEEVAMEEAGKAKSSRARRHWEKLRSKSERSGQQHAAAGQPVGVVEHVRLACSSRVGDGK